MEQRKPSTTMNNSSPFTPSLTKLTASLTPHPPPIHQACILTILRVLDNILSDPTRSNLKLRKIKVSNPAFWKRAGQWGGCIDFLMACGFTGLGEGGNGAPAHLKFEGEDEGRRERLRRGREELVKCAVEQLKLQKGVLPVCPVEAPGEEANGVVKSSENATLSIQESVGVSKEVKAIAHAPPSSAYDLSGGNNMATPSSAKAQSKTTPENIVKVDVCSNNPSSLDGWAPEKTKAAPVLSKPQPKISSDKNATVDLSLNASAAVLNGAPSLGIDSKEPSVGKQKGPLDNDATIDSSSKSSAAVSSDTVASGPSLGTASKHQGLDNTKAAQEVKLCSVQSEPTLGPTNVADQKQVQTESIADPVEKENIAENSLRNQQLGTKIDIAAAEMAAPQAISINSSPDKVEAATETISNPIFSTLDATEASVVAPALESKSDNQQVEPVEPSPKPSPHQSITGEPSAFTSQPSANAPTPQLNKSELQFNNPPKAMPASEPNEMTDLLEEIENELNDEISSMPELDVSQTTTTTSLVENGIYSNTVAPQIKEVQVEPKPAAIEPSSKMLEIIADTKENASKTTSIATIQPDDKFMNYEAPTATELEIQTQTKDHENDCSQLGRDQPFIEESIAQTSECIAKEEFPSEDSNSISQQTQNGAPNADDDQTRKLKTGSGQESKCLVKSGNGKYHGSLLNIPLPEGEFTSSDDDETKAFRLGFELCHRLLISLWHTEASLQRETTTAVQQQNATVGLANVKPWSKCSDGDHVSAAHDFIEEIKKGFDSNCNDSDPVLLVPLDFVYQAWSYLLNAKHEEASRSRTMYSWIVSNHPDLSTGVQFPGEALGLSGNISETDIAICNYVCNSLCECGLATVYGADILAFSDDVSSDLSFFIGIEQGVLNHCIGNGKPLLNDRLVSQCHAMLAKSVLPHIPALLKKEQFSPAESASLWYSCHNAIHHLLSSGMLDEAGRLLLDKKFAEARLKSMGLVKAIQTDCRERARMTEMITRSQNSGKSCEDWRQNCVRSLISMAEMLQDHSTDDDTRSMKKELGTCFHLIGEAIGSTCENMAEEIKLYVQALMLRTEAYGHNQNHESIANTLYAMGCCYHRCRNFTLGQKYYEQALKIYKKTLGYDHPCIARCLHNIGIMYATQSNYAVAMKCLKKSLSIRQSSLGENDIAVADSLCWIGNIHREKKELNEARKCFVSAHQIKVAVLGYSHAECSEILQNLGIICHDLEMYSQSLSYYKEAMLNIRGNIKGPHDIEGLNNLCESLHCIANVYRVTGQFSRALQFAEQILKRRRTMIAATPSLEKIQAAQLIRTYEDIIALTKLVSRDENGVIDRVKLAQVGSYLIEIGKLYEHKLMKPMKALLYYQEAMDGFKEANQYVQIISCLSLMGAVHVRTSSNDKALSCFSKALVLTLRNDSNVPRQSLCNADLLHNIGNCQAKRGNYKKSVISYRDSLKMKQLLLAPSDLSIAKTEHCAALALLQLGDVEEALEFFRSSLKIREEKLGPNHLDVGFSLHNIGKIYFQQGKIDQAIDYLERSHRIKKMKLTESLSSLAETEHILASGYLKQKRYFDAVPLLKSALLVYNETPDCELLSSDVLDLLGFAYSATGDKTKAISVYEESLAIKQESLGHDHLACGNVLMEIGKLQVSNNELEDALVTFREVKRIHKILLDKDNLKNAEMLVQVGSIQYRREKFDVARKCFMEALRIRRLLLEADAFGIAETLTHLGRVYQSTDDSTASVTCFQQALDICDKGDDKSTAYEVRRLLGSSLLKCEKHDEAVDSLEACLRFQEETNQNDTDEWISIAFDLATAKIRSVEHKDGAASLLERCIFLARQNEMIDGRLANALFTYGQICTKLDTNEALACFEECLEIRKQVDGSKIDISDVLFEIGVIHQSRKQYSETLESYQESLSLRQSIDVQDEKLADTFFRLGEVHRLCGKLDLAFNNLTLALGAYYMSVGKSHPSVANTFHSLGYICDAKNDIKEALKNHKMGMAIRKLNLGNDHPEVASSLDDVAGLYQKIGNNEKALECLEEGLRIRRLLNSDDMDIATNLFAMGIIFAANSDNEKAMECYDASLDISSANGNDPKLEAQTLHQIGVILASKCQYREALQKWRTSLSKYREARLADDHYMVACTLGNIEMAENVLSES